MKNAWKLFIVLELLLLIVAAWQVFQETGIVVVIVIAILNLVFVSKKKKRNSFNQFQGIVSVIALIIALLTSPAIWIMIILAVLFVGLKGLEISGLDLFEQTPWRQKQMLMVKTVTGEPKNGRRFKRPWFGTQRFGQQVFEWEDINLTVFSGDTIVDLGNTILPRQDNVVLIRKGFGRTRIIVPVGIGVMVDHSAIKGDLDFEENKYHLSNESYRLYSDDYDNNPRRVKIVTNTLFGDLEVIRL